MQAYEIVFSGQLAPDADPDRVRANLGKVFQADERRVAVLMSGRELVLKRNLDAVAAERYRATLERAGALAQVRLMDDEVEEVELAPPPEQPAWVRAGGVSRPAPVPARQAAQVEPRDLYMAAFRDVEAPDFGIADLGADVQDAKAPPVPPRLDLSGLSLAPAGSDMGQARPAPPPRAPDTSHLSLSRE